MTEPIDLYREVGRKIREARARSGKKLSQAKLASLLGVSRVSMVNIEAGRQHAPLHLLWRVAEELGTDLALLIPRREELTEPATQIQLDDDMLRQIDEAADGDPETAVKL